MLLPRVHGGRAKGSSLRDGLRSRSGRGLYLLRGLRQLNKQVRGGPERRDSVRHWLALARQMREVTGAAEWSDMSLDEVEHVRTAYGIVRDHAGDVFSHRETAGESAR